MPKPYFLARRSGLYVRFLVPLDLRDVVGSRFLIRTLRSARGDCARFVAATLGVALSEAFARMRTGVGMVDVKKLLESAQRAAESGEDRPWTASNVRVGGVDFGNVQTTGREDTLDFIEAMKAADQMVAKAWAGVVQVPHQSAAMPKAPLLSEEIAHHIGDIERRKLSPDTITDSRHSLRILLGVVGDRPVAEIKRGEIRAFWDAVRWWPANATVKPQYRDLSVPEIVARGQEEGVPSPSAKKGVSMVARASQYKRIRETRKAMAEAARHLEEVYYITQIEDVPREMVAQETGQSGERQSASSNNRDLRPQTRMRTRFQ